MRHARQRLVATLLCTAATAACADGVTTPDRAVPAAPALQQNPAAAIKVNPAMVARYAKENWNRKYGSAAGQNPFCSYASLNPGGDCTNFASQAVMAGLVGSSDPATVLSKRRSFQADRYSNGTRWYYESCGDKAPAWSGAHALYQYAAGNKASYKGLHFTLVTYDTPTKFMDYTKVQAGDIIFADWEHDGRIDHSMVVVSYDSRSWPFTSNSGYNRIRVAYQNQDPYPATGDAGLGDINISHKYQAVFYVYRPTDYNPTGL